MSYDIDLLALPSPCPTCGHDPGAESVDCPNPTYNLTPIFDLALTGEPMPNPDVAEGEVVILGKKTDRPRGLRLLSGRRASETLALIEGALARLGAAEWRDRLPPNRWGTLPDAVVVMTRLRDLAAAHPARTWQVR